MSKPREWWIYKGSNKFQNDPNHLDPFYDTVMTEHHKDAIHVIEKSAYDELSHCKQELLEALTDAQDSICSEYCGSGKHHPLCNRPKQALEKWDKK